MTFARTKESRHELTWIMLLGDGTFSSLPKGNVEHGCDIAKRMIMVL
jgi:hypothetical protein